MAAPGDVGRAVAGLSWTLLLFGLLHLVSAVAPDSDAFWDNVRQSTNAWIGIGLLVAALPPGVIALVLDRPHRRHVYAPGERRAGIRHPTALVLALLAALVLAGVLAPVV